MPQERPLLGEYLALCAKPDDNAAVSAFLEALKHSRYLRHWLWLHFAGSESVRERLAEYLKGAEKPRCSGKKLLAQLASEDTSSASSRAPLIHFQREGFVGRPYGGLSRLEVWQLIRFYQAGRIDLGAFLTVYGWQFPESVPSGMLRLKRASAAFFKEAVQGNRPEMFRHALKAFYFLEGKKFGEIGRVDFGYANWWKLSALDYLLRHPKRSYRTGELRRHLLAQRLNVDAKDIRAFCKKHGIQRDVRPGRPNKVNP
ncbi:MAG: hypothetical protein ABI222_08815 [Opitutaceae bacterium]